jgi:zinc protease
MTLSRVRSFFVASLLPLLLFLGSCTPQQATTTLSTTNSDCISTGWPQDQSDLQPDPKLVFGTLDNGLRYVILPNHEPKDRVGVYLDIQAGSLHENENQRGLAHFLEHMLFNGTTHYPPGTLVDYFQSIGMGFGADTNAHTGYDETVYKLLLPSSDRKTLDKGFEVVADYARGALLLEKEVDKERGIIFAEKRARDSARSREYKARMKFAYQGPRIAERDVIGTDETLQRADSALLREYYDTWYRPENMILVVVGDMNPETVQEMIRQRFSSLSPADLPVNCPDLGQVEESGLEALYLYEPDLGYTGVTLESVSNSPPRPDTRAEEMRLLKEYLAARMFDNRLQQLTNLENSPMTRADFYSGRYIRHFQYTTLDVQTRSDRWKETLRLLVTAVRQAEQDGFSPAEFARVRNEFLTGLKKEVQSADGRNSAELADQLIRSLNRNAVFMSPQQEFDLYSKALEEISLTEVNEVFRSLRQGRRLVEVVGTADLRTAQPDPESVVLDVYQQAMQADIKPWQQEAEAKFPYLAPPAEPARVSDHESFAGIGVDRYRFANGLILQLKKTDFKPNEITAVVALGNGRLSEPLAGIGVVSELVMAESGLGRLTRDQLAAALAPYSSRVKFQVEEEHFSFIGRGLSEESELLFQLLATSIQDPAFRADGYRRAMKKLAQMYSRLNNSVEGVMQLRGERFLAGGNPAYGLPPLKDLQKIRLQDVQNWLAPVLARGALEISVVGDFDRQQILALAAKYFGGPAREKTPVAGGAAINFPTGKTLKIRVHSKTDKALLVVGWPTADFWKISRTRRLSVLAAVLDDRLRKQIREELGATYSPYVYNRSSRVNPGYGVLRARMIVAPDQADMLTRKLKEVGAGLAREGVTGSELERAVEPVLTSIKDMVRSNRYWLESVLVLSSRHPQQLQWPLTIEKDFAAITEQEISALAAQYLQPDKAAEVILLPEPAK